MPPNTMVAATVETIATSTNVTPRIQELDNSGLLHLADAATALTQLNDTSHMFPDKRTHTVSDDDERSNVGETNAIHLTVNVPSRTTELKADDMKSERSKHRQIFPQRLMDILNDSSISEIITWLPHGNSFVIIKPTIFTDTILPSYFPESCVEKKLQKISNSSACKYPSFTRKLNRWGFRQVCRGTDAGAFHHKLFHRDKPEMCLQMVCQRSRRRKNEKDAEEERSPSSDAGSVEPSPDSQSLTETASTISNTKRKLLDSKGTFITDSESDTSSTLRNDVKSLPPKKRKHCGNTNAICDPRPITPPRTHCASNPSLQCPVSRISSTGSDSSGEQFSEVVKGKVNFPTQITMPSLPQVKMPCLLQQTPEPYLSTRALVDHNIALNNIHSLNAAVALAQAHTQSASLSNIPIVLDNMVVLASNTSTQEAVNARQKLVSPTPSSNGLICAKPNTNCDNIKKNEARDRALNAKKMLYSAFLDAMK